MSEEVKSSWEISKTEYENAFLHARHYTKLRRQDMAFVTTAQAVVFTVVGDKLTNLDIKGLALSFIAFFVLILGFNSERRLSSKMGACLQRAREIETEFDMRLLSEIEEKKKKKTLISNTLMFPLYYLSVIMTARF